MVAAIDSQGERRAGMTDATTDKMPYCFERAQKAREEHTRYEASPFPGFTKLACDVPVFIPIDDDNGIGLPDGVLFKTDADPRNMEAFTVKFDDESVKNLLEDMEQGSIEYDEVATGDGSMAAAAIPADTPIELKVYLEKIIDREGNALRVPEFLVWLAVAVAESDEEKKAIIDSALEISKKHERETILSITTNSIDRIDFMTDKVNRNVWNQWARLQPGQTAIGFTKDEESGQLHLDLDLANSGDRKNGVQRIVSYSIDFEQLENAGIAPSLGAYDKRVYEALSSLWNQVTTVTGQDTFSLKDIFYAMGYTSNQGAQTKTKLDKSLSKMSKAHVTVDNYDESSAYRNYPHFKYDASLLPMERITGYVDGQITDGLVHLFREPPLFTFARERNQITSGSVELLQTPLNKTDKNLMIEDYIREQIAWMKNQKSKRANKLTFDAIFDAAGITRRDDKARQKKTISKILAHFVGCGWIKDYKMHDDGISIVL